MAWTHLTVARADAAKTARAPKPKSLDFTPADPTDLEPPVFCNWDDADAPPSAAEVVSAAVAVLEELEKCHPQCSRDDCSTCARAKRLLYYVKLLSPSAGPS